MIRNVGVEEEFLLVDPATRRAVARAQMVVAETEEERADGQPPGSGIGLVASELTLQQVETATLPCGTMPELHRELVRTRQEAAGHAGADGVALAASATCPTQVSPRTTPNARYQEMVKAFGLTAREQLTCGCHVHVDVDGDEEAVGVLDRIQPWLPAVLALSVNSPLWQGQDTDFDSYRTQVWQRWPSAGPTSLFGSAESYRSRVDTMLRTGTLLDEGMVYFDARLSAKYPTLEVRVADVCLDVEETVLIATLVRALVMQLAGEWSRGEPMTEVPLEVLRLAQWRASRSGLSGALVDPASGTPAPAEAVLKRMVARVAPALEECGDVELVGELLGRSLSRGTGAARQRAAFARNGRPEDAMDLLLSETVPG
jgi:carboxylate-amine ligase